MTAQKLTSGLRSSSWPEASLGMAAFNALLEVDEQDDCFLKSEPSDLPETAPPQAVMERPGSVVGRFKLRERIGEGGMGIVFIAEQARPVEVASVRLQDRSPAFQTPRY